MPVRPPMPLSCPPSPAIPALPAPWPPHEQHLANEQNDKVMQLLEPSDLPVEYWTLMHLRKQPGGLPLKAKRTDMFGHEDLWLDYVYKMAESDYKCALPWGTYCSFVPLHLPGRLCDVMCHSVVVDGHLSGTPG